MRAMVGFRNVALHQYQEFSLPILRAIIDQRLEDFTVFAQAVSRAAQN